MVEIFKIGSLGYDIVLLDEVPLEQKSNLACGGQNDTTIFDDDVCGERKLG